MIDDQRHGNSIEEGARPGQHTCLDIHHDMPPAGKPRGDIEETVLGRILDHAESDAMQKVIAENYVGLPL